MEIFGAAASLLRDQFGAVDHLKWIEACGAGGKDESWAKAVASPRESKYAFPSMGLDVSLSMQMPLMNLKKNNGTYTSADKSRFSSGMALSHVSFAFGQVPKTPVNYFM